MGVSRVSRALLVWSVLVASGTTDSEKVLDPVEYCQWETFNATCEPDEVVVMAHAQYGRMRLGRCLTTDVYIGCGGDVLSQMDAKCSGRQRCLLTLPDSSLHQSQPCPKDMMAYLEASYVCTKVGTLPEGRNCSDPEPQHVLANASGMLSSDMALRSGYGLPGCPWVVRARSGQKVKVTLYDFSLASRYKTDAWYGEYGDREYCYVYAVIREKSGEKEFTVCAGSQRETIVYMSSTNLVEIILLDIDKENAQNFVFKYEATGCADMTPPANAYVIRQGEGATITCNSSTQAWHLVCKDTQWIGEYGECLPGAATAPGDTDKPLPSYGLILAVLIGVAIGIIVGFTLLATVLWCRRRGRYKRTVQREPDAGLTTLQMSPSSPGSPHCKVHRIKGEYGYTQVWEVQPSPGRSKPPETGIRKPDPAYQSYRGQRPIPGSGETLVCFHPKKDHEYESPRFETFGIGIGRDAKFYQPACYPGYGKTCSGGRCRTAQCGDSLDKVVHIEVGLESSSSPACGPVSSGGQLPAGYSVAGDTKPSISGGVDASFEGATDTKGNHYT